MSSWEQRFEEKPRRTILNILISGVAIITVVGVVGFGIRMVVNPFVQAGRVIERTIDADNVIANYEWFKRQVQDVRAMDDKVGIASVTLEAFERSAGPRESWKFDDRQEWNRLNAVLLGLRAQRTSMVAEYNARTQMANRDLFRTSDLPAELH